MSDGGGRPETEGKDKPEWGEKMAGKISKFEDLIVWKESMRLAAELYIQQFIEKTRKISAMLYKLIQTRKENF